MYLSLLLIKKIVKNDRFFNIIIIIFQITSVISIHLIDCEYVKW